MKFFNRVVLCLILSACCAMTASALDKSYYAESSKLASGKWVKISVVESGIYQITATDIASWGLGSDLSQIHVFGYGGAPLSETMLGDNYADDLPQMPVVRSGDRILFYAQGPVTWRYVNRRIEQRQVQHPYALSGFYFVTNDSRFSDIEIAKSDGQPSSDNIETTYIERLFHEVDIANPSETGRVFLGESFVTNKNQSYQFTLDGLVEGSDVNVLTSVGVKMTSGSATMSHSYNDAPFDELADDVFNPTTINYTYSNTTKSFVLNGTNTLNYAMSFSNNGNVDVSRLDYITVNYKRTLAMTNGILAFGLNDAQTNVGYRIAGAGSNTRLWDVTLPFAPVQLNVDAAEGNITFTPEERGRREYVAFNESGTFLQPEFVGEVKNQNIHAEPIPDMIILSPSAYLEQARRVARLHEERDSFRVLVLDHEKVFNEFSSGTQDAMAYRRLCKMFYDRGMSDDGHHLGYLLLMGSGSYDNRQVGVDASAMNYPRLLTWQTETSNNDNYSITSDDYFGVLDDASSCGINDKMNIAVGRMIVKSVGEARTVVNKLVKYVTSPIYGSWKNQALHVADDENFGIHMEQDTLLIRNARANGGSNIVFNRVYIDAFNAVSSGGSRNYPDARTKMFTALREGTLWWNYIGHASTQNWTGEGLLMRSDVETQLYYKRLPVLYGATCEFCRFDNAVLSSGEHMFLNANGGVIALICPARIAFIPSNGVLSGTMGQFIYSRDENGKQRRIGDILRLAKNSITADDDNNRRYFLFGDPAMRLAWAPYTAKIETINGKEVDGDDMPVVFKAREQVEFTGKIFAIDGSVATDFNGAVISTLFGPEQSITTHGYGSEGQALTYEDRSNRLAINVDTVIGGEFTVRLIIPSEVNNEYDNYRPALINLYAYDSRDSLEAKGSNSDFYIYGYEDEEVADTQGPDIIKLGLNDENFADGSDVNESPLVLATVSDESGVNFSSAGIGHCMTLTVDGTTSYNDLVSYYSPMYVEQGTLGDISYQLNDMTPGLHTLRLRVWDVYNNLSEKTINFNVVKGLAPEIADVYCANNPATVETSFYVKHNRPDAVVSVTIEVYDLMGRQVWSTTQAGRSDMYTSTPITWDLIDNSGRRVPRGIYVYRATISTDGVKEATKAKKLAVAGQ